MATILAPVDYVNTARRTGLSTIDVIGAREIPVLGRSLTRQTNVRASAQF